MQPNECDAQEKKKGCINKRDEETSPAVMQGTTIGVCVDLTARSLCTCKPSKIDKVNESCKYWDAEGFAMV